MVENPWKNEVTWKKCREWYKEVPLDLTKINERRNRRVLRESGAEWKVAATSMHHDVLLDSEECQE